MLKRNITGLGRANAIETKENNILFVVNVFQHFYCTVGIDFHQRKRIVRAVLYQLIHSNNTMADGDDQELIEKRLELRQKLKSQLLTLSPSSQIFHRFHPFIPNSRDNDFLEKQGLDCVINYLTMDSMEIDESLPYLCTNCQVDSTENWWCSISEEKEKDLIYLCDQCEQIRMRRLILQQHRESMKSAFLQAKESERRLEVDYEKQNKRSRRMTSMKRNTK